MATVSSPFLRLNPLLRRIDGREETDRLFGILTHSALYNRPIPERHRIVFYIGHLEAFDWNLLRERLGLDQFHPEFDRLFAFGIDPVDGGLPSDQPGDWPMISQVLSYQRRIRQELDTALANATENEDLLQLMNIAIEHRLMHAETLEYMFHQLPFDCKIPPASKQAPPANPVTQQMINIPAGPATLGLHRDSGLFGWDNEFEAHIVDVPAFSVDKYKVTNGEFLKFVESGGYSQRSLWSDTDWTWKSNSDVSHPVFWVPTNNGFRGSVVPCRQRASGTGLPKAPSRQSRRASFGTLYPLVRPRRCKAPSESKTSSEPAGSGPPLRFNHFPASKQFLPIPVTPPTSSMVNITL